MTDSETITRAHITAADSGTLLRILDQHRFRVGGPVRRDEDGRSGIDVYVNADGLALIHRLAVTVEVLADHTAVGEARQAEVGAANRFAEPGAVPPGLGHTSGGAT